MRVRLKVAASRRRYHAVVKRRSRLGPVRDRQQQRTAGPESESGRKKAIDGIPPCYRSGTTGGTEHARRPAVAAALDLQESAAARASTVSTRARAVASTY